MSADLKWTAVVDHLIMLFVIRAKYGFMMEIGSIFGYVLNFGIFAAHLGCSLVLI